MEARSPGLAGQKGLRRDILVELKKAQPLTAKELGDRFSVSANAVRRHLKELEAEGLVIYGREQRGNGAPTFCYRLSPPGEAVFPRQYEEPLKRLIDHVIGREGREAALAVIEQQYADLRSRLGSRLDEATPIDRLRTVAEVMEDAGFMAEPQDTAHGSVLAVHNCAIHAVADCLPEVCQTEIKFLEDVLRARVERRTHIIDGCNACQYAIDFHEDVKDAEAPMVSDT